MTSYMESLLQQPASSDHKNPDQQEIASVDDNHSTNNDAKVDTSRAFRSVKEAVAIFDERLLAGVFFSSSPKPQTVSTSFKNQETKPSKASSVLPSSPPPPPLPPQLPLVLTTSSNISPIKQKPKEDDNSTVKNMLKKLENELEETKRELNLLKERESETEVALATLNAELHKNMAKMAEAEAAAAGEKAALGSKRSTQLYIGGGGDHKYVGSSHEDDIREEITKMERYSTSLAEVLSLGEKEGYFDHFQDKKTLKKNKMASIKKEKPIIPLVGDFFSRKKKKSSKSLNKL